MEEKAFWLQCCKCWPCWFDPVMYCFKIFVLNSGCAKPVYFAS